MIAENVGLEKSALFVFDSILRQAKHPKKGQNDREIAAEKRLSNFQQKEIGYISKGDWLHFKKFSKNFADIYDKPIKKLR